MSQKIQSFIESYRSTALHAPYGKSKLPLLADQTSKRCNVYNRLHLRRDNFASIMAYGLTFMAKASA